MSAAMPWVKMTATMVGFVGVGYALMRAVTPTPEQLYQKMSPDMRRKVDATRAARLAAEAATAASSTNQQQVSAQATDPDSQKPKWAGTPPS